MGCNTKNSKYERILNDTIAELKERYKEKDTPTSFEDLKKDNMDLHVSSRLIEMIYGVPAIEYLIEQGLLKTPELKEEKRESSLWKKINDFNNDTSDAKCERAFNMYVDCISKIEKEMDKTGNYSATPIAGLDSYIKANDHIKLNSDVVSAKDFFVKIKSWMSDDNMGYDGQLGPITIYNYCNRRFPEIAKKNNYWYEGELGVRYPVALAVAYINYVTPIADIFIDFYHDKYELRGEHSLSKRVCVKLTSFDKECEVSIIKARRK